MRQRNAQVRRFSSAPKATISVRFLTLHAAQERLDLLQFAFEEVKCAEEAGDGCLEQEATGSQVKICHDKN